MRTRASLRFRATCRGALRAQLLTMSMLASLAAAGCFSQAHMVKANIVTKGVVSNAPALPLTVAVAAFVDSTGDKKPEPDRCYIYTASYVNALDDSRVFQGVYAEVEAPQSDLRIEGTIKESNIYDSSVWFGTWIITGIATFGLFPGIGALLGLPYGSHNAYMELETRLIARNTGAVVATYKTEWSDTLHLNIYNDDKAKGDYYNNPKVALQAVMDDQMRKIAGDVEKIKHAVPPKAPPPPPPGAPTGNPPPGPDPGGPPH